MKLIIQRARSLSPFFCLFALIVTIVLSGCKTPRTKARGYGCFFVQYMGGGTAEGERTVEVGSTGGMGVGFGGYIIKQVSLNFEFLIGVQDRTARSGGYACGVGNGDVKSYDFNLEIELLKTPLTPIVTGGVGFFSFDRGREGLDDYYYYGAAGSELKSSDALGTVESVCRTLDETSFAYNAGGGLKWNVSDFVFLKALYRAKWTKLNNTDETLLLDGLSLGIGGYF